MIPVLLILCSGFFHFTLASNRLRFFIFPGNKYKWDGAFNECNAINASLVTWYDKDDTNFTCQLTRTSWLGLKRSQNNVSTWSNGDNMTYSLSNVKVTENGEQICEAIENKTWKGFNCSDRKPFMCYKDSTYTLIEKEPRNWCQAQHYCRKHFTDLVSISSETQNQQLIQKGDNKTFWIGLMHDEWEWVDKSCSTYREWYNPQNYGNCTMPSLTSRELLYKQDCTAEYDILCSKGSVRIKVIKEYLTWEKAFNYCKANHSQLLQIEDEDDQKAVKQWLNHTVAEGKFWIGLRQSHVFGFWIWSDKTVSYSNWKEGRIPEMPMSNHCGVINIDDYRWSDENCWLPLPFLCEEEISYMRKK